MRRLGGTMWSSWALGRLENIGLGLDFGEMLQVSCVHESWYSVSNVENGRRHVCIVQHRIKYGQRYHHEYLKYVLIDLIYLAISPWYFCCQSNSLSISTCLVSTYRASCSVLPPQNLVSGPLLHKWLCVGYLPNLFPSPPPTATQRLPPLWSIDMHVDSSLCLHKNDLFSIWQSLSCQWFVPSNNLMSYRLSSIIV